MSLTPLPIRPTRRAAMAFMAVSCALLGSTALTQTVLAQPENLTPVPFSFDGLSEEMRRAAAQPYVEDAAPLPDAVAGLDYDRYRLIQFRPEQARWAGDESGFQVHAFHLGWLFKQPVQLFEVAQEKAAPMDFSAADFLYRDAAVGEQLGSGLLPGVAGFRINYPLNTAGAFDELLSFLGASYFRALGQGNIYGLSARGLVINSWSEGPEEFPRFSRFFLERPAAGQPLVIYASLDSPSVTGAYRFEITPGSLAEQATVMDVTARLFFRADVEELGIAPLTSMFLFSENNRTEFDDYREQVHDSNGLFIARTTGETFWRPLNNPPRVANSYMSEKDPVAFGLHQRGREFSQYQDAGAHYERRPSLNVEPVGGWGKGVVRLIEIPTRLEVEDNIVAFFVPDEPARAGTEREFRYRLRWGDMPPETLSDLGYVLEARSGAGGVSGVENSSATLRKFVVDFTGGELPGLDPAVALDGFTSVSGGRLVFTTLSKVTGTEIWRMTLDVEVDPGAVLELRAYIVGLGRKLTETWLYQWRARA